MLIFKENIMKKLSLMLLVVAGVSSTHAMDKALALGGAAAGHAVEAGKVAYVVAANVGALYGTKKVMDAVQEYRKPSPALATKEEVAALDKKVTALLLALHGPEDQVSAKFDGAVFKKAMLEVTEPTFAAFKAAEAAKVADAEKKALEAAAKAAAAPKTPTKRAAAVAAAAAGDSGAKATSATPAK